MKNLSIIAWIAAGLILTAVAAGAVPAEESSSFLKGKVVNRGDSTRPLDERCTAARDDFRKSGQGNFYFIGYLFPSRDTVCHNAGGSRGPWEVTVAGSDVKFRGRGDSESFDTRNESGPAGLLLLYSLSQSKAGALSVHLLDPKATYEFKTAPVYWLGTVEAEASVAFLEREFDRGGEKLQESLVFIINEHSTPRAFDFLKKTVLDASRSLEVRKNAVFWVGNSRDPRSLDLLKQTLAAAREDELKEHVVFALSLSDRREALQEMIRIAKSDPDRKVRKRTIFWLGQKASQETAKTLKEVVDQADEDLDVKDSAVFAISQLPKDKAVPLLLAIAKENKSPSVRKKAIFWLGQTDDEQALKLFEEILLKKH